MPVILRIGVSDSGNCIEMPDIDLGRKSSLEEELFGGESIWPLTSCLNDWSFLKSQNQV